MMISPVSLSTYTYPAAGVSSTGQAVGAANKINGVTPVAAKGPSTIEKVKPTECQTCKNRKYMDQSNEADVSFKAPAHISPSASFAAVSAHEQEHVSNAVNEGNKPGSQLVSSTVTLKMAICPECGTSYVAGGVTNTTIKYNVSNPYDNARKSLEGTMVKGMNFNAVA